MFDGHGIYHYNDGSRYIGHWKMGLQSGEGIMFSSDAGQYKGTFVQGLKHGRGLMTYQKNGQIKEIPVSHANNMICVLSLYAYAY